MKFRLLIIVALVSLFALPVFAQTESASETAPEPGPGNNVIVNSRDAIGLRVVPNPEHYSPLLWYQKNIQVKGAPQSLIVDGYEAVRDGRSVYVNAAKLVTVKRCSNNPAIICQSDNQCGQIPNNETRLPEFFIPTAWAANTCDTSTTPELYTNIYIISYNQDPENATTDIFGQLLQYWKFNIEVKNCSVTVTQACDERTPCPGTELCQQTGSCSDNPQKACVIDSDCNEGAFCNSKKSTVVRDTRRLSDLRVIKDKLEDYNRITRRYPSLESGTYLTNRSVSTWPSWSGTFSSTLGSNVPVDQINKMGTCPAGFEASTCWNDTTKQFAGTADPLAMPAGSKVYYYQYKPADNSYRFCSIVESGYIQAKAPGTPYCQAGRNCVRNCSGRNCGSDGCGGSCGTCATGSTCQSGLCRINSGIQNQQ